MSESLTAPESKEDWLKILKEHVVTIIFEKKDGTDRKLRGTLDPEIIGSKGGQTESSKPSHLAKSETSCPIFELDPPQMRGFRIDSVSYLEVEFVPEFDNVVLINRKEEQS